MSKYIDLTASYANGTAVENTKEVYRFNNPPNN